MTVQAMKAGAIEFLTKPFRDQDLLDAVNVGLARDRARRENQQSVRALRARYDELTPRERAILVQVVQGGVVFRQQQRQAPCVAFQLDVAQVADLFQQREMALVRPLRRIVVPDFQLQRALLAWRIVAAEPDIDELADG